jgi:hypothetical protein
MVIITSSIIDQPIHSCFEYIVPVDLTHIFKRYKFLPGVIRTDNKEKWIKPGLTRTVYFEDRNTAFEELLTVNSNNSFSYRIVNFTSPLRFLVTQIIGNWKFTELENKKTNVVWGYELIPKNFIANWIISIFLLNDIKTFCQNSMDIISKDLN